MSTDNIWLAFHKWLSNNGNRTLALELQLQKGLLKQNYFGKMLLIGDPEYCKTLDNLAEQQRGWLDSYLLLVPQLTTAMALSDKYQVIVNDLQGLPLQSDTFEMVIIPHTLDLLQVPSHLLLEAHRILKAEGRIMIQGFNRFSLLNFYSKLALKRNNWQWLDTKHSLAKVIHYLKLLSFDEFSITNDRVWLLPFVWGSLYTVTARKKVLPLDFVGLNYSAVDFNAELIN